MSETEGKTPAGALPLDGLEPDARNALVADRIFGKAELRGRPFTTDLLTAMLVVERVSDDGYNFKCHVGPDGRSRVSFLREDKAGDKPSVVDVSGETLPVAICNAALELQRRLAKA